MSTRTDAHHGRQGGHWLDDDYEPTDVANAPRCDVCGDSLLVGQHRRHAVCDPASIVGERCTCRPGCTNTHIGDRGYVPNDDAVPTCVVCVRLAGLPYAETAVKHRWRKATKAKADDAPDDGDDDDDQATPLDLEWDGPA